MLLLMPQLLLLPLLISTMDRTHLDTCNYGGDSDGDSNSDGGLKQLV